MGNLCRDDLKELIPKMGPRNRFLNWLQSEYPKDNTEANGVDVIVTSNGDYNDNKNKNNSELLKTDGSGEMYSNKVEHMTEGNNGEPVSCNRFDINKLKSLAN